MIQTIINLISGLAGGNIAGTAAKQNNPGTILNSIAGLTGGGLTGALIASWMNSGTDMSAGTVISGIAGSGAGGAILTAIFGFIKSKRKVK